MSDNPIISLIRDRVEARMRAIGISMKAASLGAGLNETAVRDIINRQAANGPTVTTLAALTEPLQCSLAYLVGADNEDVLADELRDNLRALVGLTEGLVTLGQNADGTGFAVAAVAERARLIAHNSYDIIARKM